MYSERRLEQLSLVFVDVETTGLEPSQGDSVCEIGAVKSVKGEVVEEFQSLVNPGRAIPHYISQIHNIFDEDVKDAPYFKEVVDKVLDFLKGSIICGYNVGFDLGFLNNELEKIQYPLLCAPALDVLLMARKTFTGLERYNLGAMARYLNIDTDNLHRAFGDAALTSKVYKKLKEELTERGMGKMKEYLSVFGIQNEFLEKMQEPKVEIIKESIIAGVSLRVTCFSNKNTINTFTLKPGRLVEGKFLCLSGIDTGNSRPVTIPLRRMLDLEVF